MANSWKALTGLPPISLDTMVLLTDGTVIVHDAGGKDWYRLAPDNQGNYATGAWSGPFSMANTRQFFASGVLKDGRFFVLGGEYSDAGNDTPLGEIFDPLTNSWSALSKPAAFNWINGDVSACILADGRVLFGALLSSRTALWDPAVGTWTEAGTAFGTQARTKNGTIDEETWTLLPDGTVLTVEISATPLAEKYDPVTDTWVRADQTVATLTQPLTLMSLNDTTVTPPVPVNISEIGPAIVLPDGRLFVIGATGHTALYTPPAIASQPGTWTAGPNFPPDTSGNNFNSVNGNIQTAIDAPAVLLPGGKVLCVAGDTVREVNNGQTQFWSAPCRVFVYDPVTNGMTLLDKQPPSSGVDTWKARFLLLPTGQVLFTTEQASVAILTVDPALLGSPQVAWKPVITQFTPVMALGHHYGLFGRQINGLSQACSYGDDAQMGTNYPIARLTNIATGVVSYIRTHGHSSLGIATGAAIESTIFDIPSALPTGPYQLRVIANGIPSDPVTVQIAPAVPAIVVDPHDELAFGTVCDGPKYLTLEVFNVGGLDLIVDSVQRLSGSTDFTVRPNPVTPLTIAPGDHVDFTVRYLPTTRNVAESATIRIVSNDSVKPNFDLLTTGFAGTGRLETVIADKGNLGKVCLGSFGETELTLNNNGPCELSVRAIASSSLEFEVPSVNSFPLIIATGVSIDIPIRFTPTSAGAKSATITVTSDDPAGPKTVAVSGVVSVPSLALIIADAGNFGHACLGSFVDQFLTLNNNGHCTLTVTGITSSVPEFVVPSVISYPLTIEAGSSLQVPIRFQPTSLGVQSAAITITSNDPAGAKSVAVSGTAPPGKLAITGSAYFGEVDCGFAEKTVSICNVGECPLHVDSVAFRRKRRHFRLINNPFPATLQPGSCLGVVIRYRASCEPECCELVIASDDPVTPIRTLDVIAYTRCEEKCGCKKEEKCGCRKKDRGCDDDDRRNHDDHEDDD